MWYFKGLKQNGKEVFISLDSALNIECSNNFVIALHEQKWLRSKGDIAVYLRLVLALKEVPVACHKLDFALAANQHVLSKSKPSIIAEINPYYDEIAEAIFEKFEKRTHELDTSLLDFGKTVIDHTEYVICDHCSVRNSTGVIIKLKNYVNHISNAHKNEVGSVKDINYKLSDPIERLNVLKHLILKAQNDMNIVKMSHDVTLKRKQLYWEATVGVFLSEIKRYQEEIVRLNKSSIVVDRLQAEIVKLKKVNEGMLSYDFRSDVLAQKQVKDLSNANREIEKLNAKNHLLESEIKKIKQSNKILESERDILREKLENVQRFIKSIDASSPLFKNKIIEEDEREKITLGLNSDGSSGFHERRENGRYGSLSSFDNYGDEYNEKDDP